MLDTNEEAALRRVLDAVVAHLRDSSDPRVSVSENLVPDALARELDVEISRHGVSPEQLAASVESYLGLAVKTGNTRFVNQLFAGAEIAGVIAEMVTAATNTSMYTYEVAPAATVLEQVVIRRMAEFVGYEHGEGVLVNGGSNANMMAMLCARHRADPSIKRAGVGGRRLTAFVSDQAHYSFFTAANVLGLGGDAVLEVATDDRGCMLPDRLDEAMHASARDGGLPFFVGATAGTTVLGAFDPTDQLAEVAHRHGAWLHVDGAWGGPVLFSDLHRGLLAGCARADSFAWDAHKLMGVPLLCTALLLRERGRLRDSCFASKGTDYIFHDDPAESLDLGPLSLQCGRRVDALKLWLAWKRRGDDGYAQLVDRLMEVAGRARRYIDAHPRLELMAEPMFLNLCFRYAPVRSSSSAAVDALNVEIRERLARTGELLVNYAPLGDRLTIRFVVVHPEITASDVERSLGRFAEIGDELAAGSDPSTGQASCSNQE